MAEEYGPTGKGHAEQQWESAERKADALEGRIEDLERENERLRQGFPPDHLGKDTRAQHGPAAERQARAEQKAQQEAFEEFGRSPAAGEIGKLFARVIALEAKFARMHGRGGIVVTNGEVIDLVPPDRNLPEFSFDYEEIELTFCDEDDVQHTGTFLVKIGSIVPPL